MTTNSSNFSDGSRQFASDDLRLRSAVESIASSAVKQACVECVIDRALRLEFSIHQTMLSESSDFDSSRRSIDSRRVSLAWRGSLCVVAVAIVTIVAVGWFIVPGETSFAQVQAAVAKLRTVQYRVLDYHGNDDPFVTTVVIVPTQGTRAEGPGGSVSISSLVEKKLLAIDHKSRKATLYDLYFTDSSPPSMGKVYQLITQGVASGFKRLEPAKLDGKNVDRFEVRMDGTFVVSVDPETKLPLRMELHMEKGLPGGRRFREVITDFVYDTPVDDSRFSIKIPQDYQVEVVTFPKDRQPIDVASIVVSSEEGFTGLKFGSTVEQVIERLGTPDHSRGQDTRKQLSEQPSPDSANQLSGEMSDNQYTSLQLAYYSLGFELHIGPNGLDSIRCFGRGRMGDIARDFIGSTDKGIRLGASFDDVLEAYGPPEVRTSGRHVGLDYPHSGIQFFFSENQLVEIRFAEPVSENIVIHDNRDGSWTESLRGPKFNQEPKIRQWTPQK